MRLTQEEWREVLVDSGGVTEQVFKQTTDEAKISKIDIGTALLKKGRVTDEQFGQLMANFYGVPYVNLRTTNVPKELLAMLPSAFAKHYHAVPIVQNDDFVKIGVSNPNDISLKALLEKYVRIPVKFVYVTPGDVEANLFRLGEDPGQVLQTIIDKVQQSGKAEANMITLVDALFEYAYQFNASDLHVEPEDEYSVIRLRIDGVLRDIGRIPVTVHEAVLTRLKVLARLATDEHRAAQDGKIEHKSKWGDTVDIRVSIVPTVDGEKAVLRFLSDKSRELHLKDLGFEGEDLQAFEETIKKPWGMILVTGPTGSGKTTTLYAALKELNKREINISTIEDPVEYDIDGINQIQVNTKTNLTFAQGLRALVRQDPDVIMVGEIRDKETADIAVNAAMTGHLVFSTLHTNDASTAFPRLLDMEVEDFLISSTVLAVLAQRLVRKICLTCIESYIPDAKRLQFLEQMPSVKAALLKDAGKETLEGIRLFRGKGCPTCHNSGYRGRVGIFEILEVTDGVRTQIMKQENADIIRQGAISAGMRTMLQDGIKKILIGRTTLEEVLRVTKE